MSDHQDPKVEIETLTDDDLDSVSGGATGEVRNTGSGSCSGTTNTGTGTCT